MCCTNMPAARICCTRSPHLDLNIGQVAAAWRLSQVCPHYILHVPAGMQPGLWNPSDAITLISAAQHANIMIEEHIAVQISSQISTTMNT